MAGIQLPAGSRCTSFWATDAGVRDAISLAGRLAKAFPRTGLWPILWTWADEAPDAYINRAKDLSVIDRLTPSRIVAREWRQNGYRGNPPSLARAPRAAARRDPFTTDLARSLTYLPAEGPLLMLVPVHRPADAPAALGLQQTEYFSSSALAAVLRSWEERFGAVLTALTPSTVELSVSTPPDTPGQARRLAAEIAAITPSDDQAGADRRGLASSLRSSRITRGYTSQHYWSLGWSD